VKFNIYQSSENIESYSNHHSRLPWRTAESFKVNPHGFTKRKIPSLPTSGVALAHSRTAALSLAGHERATSYIAFLRSLEPGNMENQAEILYAYSRS